MGEITGLRGNLEIKVDNNPQGYVYLKGEILVKKYILKIYYDSDTQEILHLSEQFSDEDVCKLVIDNEEHEIPVIG